MTHFFAVPAVWEQTARQLLREAERQGQKEKVRQALEQAQTAPLKALPGGPVQAREIFSQMCRLVQFRQDDPNYLKNPEYGQILQS